MIFNKDLQQEGVGFDILFEDEDYIIVNKRNGLAVQAIEKEQEDLEKILNRRYNSPIFVIHRIDMPVSGLIIFGKNKWFAKEMTEMIKNRENISKTYLAIVKGQPIKDEIVEVRHWIKKLHNRAMTADECLDENYKEAILTYEFLQSFDHYELLKINLLTGRFHQIRAQLATLEMPIKGDLKYGSRRPNIDRSICLLSYKLKFKHPKTGEIKEYFAPLPTNDSIWQSVNPEILRSI
jgi:23S rRNA pseudouridine1911/1915/1917 synthase